MKCNECGLSTTGSNGLSFCQRFQREIDKNTDYCSFGVSPSDLIQCDMCHMVTLQPAIVFLQKGHTMRLCDNCLGKLGSCYICANNEYCAFDSDPSSLPKQIQKQIPVQGGYMITTIRNPDRIAITCAKGCKCYDTETQACNRTVLACENYIMES